MNKMQHIDPGWNWDEDFPLSQGIRTGNLVFLSGQVPFDSNGNALETDAHETHRTGTLGRPEDFGESLDIPLVEWPIPIVLED